MDVKSLGGDFSQFVASLENLGMQVTGSSAYYGVVEGFVPVSALPALARLPQTMSGQPIYTPVVNKAYQGIGYNEAGTSESADAARSQFHVDGTGVTVGVLSDSANRYQGGLPDSYATGDLNPSNPVQVIQDAPPNMPKENTDEGRGMLEQIHDVAPGAKLKFATAEGGDLTFANNIKALAAARSNIIVDDVAYADEPMFQDGFVSQAVSAVTAQGVSYFSAAANNGPDNGYLSTFRAASGTVPRIGSGTFMNFNPNGGTNLLLQITVHGPGVTADNPGAEISFQYDQPFATQQPMGSTGMVTSNLNIYVLDATTGAVVVGPDQNENNVAHQEPIQFITIPDPGTYYVAIQVVSGPNPGHIEFTSFNETSPVVVSQQYGSAGGTSYPSSFGHAAAAATIGVGATPWWAPSPYLGQTPLASEPFSSSGPRLVDLSPQGTPIAPQVIQNPTITAPDGGNTSFFIPDFFLDTSNPPFPGEPATSTNLVPANQQSHPVFFGTSSAAPDAAAVAALMVQKVPGLTPAQIRATMIATAQPMNGTPQGTWDPQAGFGLIDAVRALSAVAPLAGSATTTTVTSSVTSPVFGQPVTLTARVRPTAPGGGTPTGVVDFFDTATNTDLGTAPLSGGLASRTITVPAGGSNLIEVFYGGDSSFASSTGYLNLIALRDATTTTATASPNPAPYGQLVAVSITVVGNGPGIGTPTGTVTIFDDTYGFLFGSVPLVDGAVTVHLDLPVGKNTLTVTYNGDGNFLPSSTTLTVTVLDSVLVLDPTAVGALSVSGNAHLTTPGTLVVDSSSQTALSASGNAQVAASFIGVVGGVQTSGHAVLSPTPATGVPPESDPLAGLPPPPAGAFLGLVNLSGSSSRTISPGIYSQITVSGNASLRLQPGIYIIAGGGLTVSGNGHISMAAGGSPDPITGTGVIVYNAGSSFPNPGGTFGAITIGGNSTVQLALPSTGAADGLVLFQSHDNTKTLSLSGSAHVDLSGGILYAPSALLSISGNAQLGPADLIVDELQIQSNGSAGGSGSTAGGSTAELPQGPLGLSTASATANSAAAAPLSSFGPAAARPGWVPSTARVTPAAASTTPVLASKVTVYLTSARDDEAGLESTSLLDSEALSDVAAGLAAIQGSQGNATGKKTLH
jgi:hypothetical protein